MNQFPSFVFKNPKSTLFLLVIITAILAQGIGHLERRNSFDGELPADDPINIGIDKVESIFGERSMLLIGIETDNVYNAQTIEKIKQVTTAIGDLPYAIEDEVISLSTIQNMSSREWGLETGGFIDHIPTTEQGWTQLRSDVEDNNNVIGKLVSKKGNLAIVGVALEDGFEGGEVYDAAKILAAEFDGPEQIHISGAPILVEDVQRGISADSRKFMPIAIILIFIGFYICFRRASGVFLPVVMVVMSIVWTMGAMGYIGLPVTVVSNALPVIMVAVASSYGIHFMNAYYSLIGNYSNKHDHIQATLDKIAAPILITGLTSALGSASLLIFKITSLKEFGVIGAVGFLFATFICLTLLPALCSIIPSPREKLNEGKRIPNFLGSLTQWGINNRWKVICSYAVIIPLCLYLSTHVRVGDDYIKFFPKSHDSRIAAEVFNDNLNGIRVMDIMIDASDYDGIKDVDFYNDLRAFQSYISGLEHVGSTHSYVNVLGHMQETMNDELTGAELTNEEIAQYLMLYEMSAAPGEVFNLRDEDYNYAKVQAFLTSSKPEDHKDLYENIIVQSSTYFSGNTEATSFGGDVMNRISLGSYIVSGKIQNIILALIIVLLTCTLIFRSFKKGLLTLLPIISSLIMVFGVMGLIGIRLGISTSLLTAMIVGIGIDFAVHYLISFYNEKKHQEENTAFINTSKDTGKAISYDAISNIAGFSILSFSGFLPLQHFGWLLAFSMLLIFINTIVIYPALVSSWERRSVSIPFTLQQS